MKKVLGLVISNRRLGNSEILVKEIMQSIPEDCQKELIRVTDLKLEPCKACYRCLRADKECPVKDDYNFLIKKIREADALVIGVPVYVLGPHGYFKMLMDRMLGVQNHVQDTAGKPCVIVSPYGTKGWDGYSKAALMILPRLLRMKVVDCWMVHATLPAESVMNPENISYAQSLGRGIFNGREYAPGKRDCSFCGSDIFRLLPGNRVECPVCGATGFLDQDGVPDFTDADYNRFSDEQLEEHFINWLLEMKNRFSQEKAPLLKMQKNYQSQDWWIKP